MLTLEPGSSTGAIFTAVFSPARPLVIAAGGVNGTVYVYDLQVRLGALRAWVKDCYRLWAL